MTDWTREPTDALIQALRDLRSGDGARASLEREVKKRASCSYSDLALLSRPVHVYWPAGLTASPVRASFHVALEADQLETHDLFQILQPYLASEDRFRELLDHSERLALGARIRVATLCQRIAIAANAFGPEAFIRKERESLYNDVLGRLVEDRDPEVGLRASWAVGLWALSSSHWKAWLKNALDESSTPQRRRRALAAATALWVHGQVKGDDLARDLREGLGRQDSFALANALLAMRFGLRTAPRAVLALAAEVLGKKSPPEVLIAAGELAWWAPAIDEREALLNRVRAFRGEAPPAALSVVLGASSRVAGELVGAHRLLVEAAARSPMDAFSTANYLATLVQAASSNGEEEVQEALERILFDSTLFRDALLVGAESAEARRTAYETWVGAVAAVRATRLAALARSKGADAWRRATRALDASARGFGRDGAPESSLMTDLGHDAQRLQGIATTALLGSELAAHEIRPACTALVTAAEVGSLDSQRSIAEAASTLFLSPADRALRHGRSAALVPAIRSTLDALLQLESELEPPKRKKKPTDAAAVTRREGVGLTPLLSRTSLLVLDALGDEETPLVRFLRAVEHAARVMLEPGQAGVSPHDAWKAVIDETARLRGSARGRSSLPSAERVDKALGSLFARDVSNPRMMKDEAARRTLTNALPPALAPLLDALRPPATPTPPSPPRKLAFGLKAGQVISDFIVEEVLGGGAMGYCVLVVERRPRPKHAAKRFVLKFPRGNDVQVHRAFVDEARTLITLSHTPHVGVVQFFGYMTRSYKRPFLVMDYVDGPPLDSLIKKAPLPVEDALVIGKRLAEALDHVHQQNIAHHDLKPSNVIIGKEGAVLVDFGIAGAPATSCGTMLYMSPERFRERVIKDSRPSDVFSLGCLLHELWTRTPLLEGPIRPTEANDIPKAILDLSQDVANLSRDGAMVVYGSAAGSESLHRNRVHAGLADAPDELRASLLPLILAMLAQKPEDRPSARDVARALARV